MREIKQENLDLKQQNSNLKSELHGIRKKLNDVEQFTNAKREGQTTEKKTVADTKSFSSRMKTDVNLSRGGRQIHGAIGFTAYLDHVLALGNDQPVVFNQVLTNEGRGYSNNTGIFRAPVPGLYLFAWAATAKKVPGQNGYDIFMKLMVNGQYMIEVVAESYNDYFDNQGSSTVVLMLNPGDEVWVAHERVSSLYGQPNERSTSFTGVLLFETEGHGSVIGK